MDRVQFRTYPDGSGVVAVLPDVPANPGRVTCYVHLGQHGEGDLGAIHAQTRPATRSEYKSLAAELKSLGYELRVVSRITRAR